MPEPEIRSVLIQGLIKLMDADPHVILIDTPEGQALGTQPIKESHPEQYFAAKGGEEDLTSMATGMARWGFTPFITSFSPFTSRRREDRMAVAMAFGRAPLKVIGTDPGVAAQEEGGSGMSFEDIAIMRSMAGFTIVEPADAASMETLLPQVSDHPGPVYLRTYRMSRPTIYNRGTPLRLGRAEVLRPGTDVSLMASGVEVVEALKAASALDWSGISAEVVDIHTVKPLDHDTVQESARRTGAVVTCDNAHVNGGLGDAVSQLLSEELPVPMARIGVRDETGEFGPIDALLDDYRLSATWISKAAEKVMSKKKILS